VSQWGQFGCRLTEFFHRTHTSWSGRRWVIGKAEYLAKVENPRFVVTNLSRQLIEAAELY
jgi:hypothetical protein